MVVTESEYVGDAKKILKLDKSATAADVEKDVKLLISLMGFEKDESGPAPKEALERYAKLTGSKVEDIPSYKIRTGAQKILKELGPAAVKEIAKTVVQTDDAEIRRRARQVLDHSVTGSSECNQALQLSHNLDAVRLRDGRSPETEEFRAKTLEEPTPKVTEKDFARAKEVKKALDSAVEDLGKQAGDKPFERIYERLKEVNELTSLPEKVARQRIFAARHMNENGLYEDALQQLEWGLKDDMKTCDDHYAFHLVAVDALKQVSPETAKDWMKKAEKAGVDMKYLSVMGAPKFK